MLLLALAFATQSSPGSPQSEASSSIDRILEERAKEAGVLLAPVADDARFLRRVTLDLTGVVPDADEVLRFLADPDPSKRQSVIEELVASDACTSRLARFLLDMTTGSRATYVWFANLYEYLAWLELSLREGHGYDRIVRDLVTATGQTNTNGATNYVMFHRARPDRLAGGIAEAFLGSDLACAQCHDHPARPYTREQFWGVAAFFAATHSYIVTNGDHGITDARFGRIPMPSPERPEFLPFEMLYENDAVPVRATWLDGSPAPSEDDLRGQLAEFLVDDPAFAPNLVNRLWRHLLGRALAEPVGEFAADDLHADLLDRLAREFVASGFDLRAMLRCIVSSRTYQRSGGPPRAADERLFAHALLRPLDVDQLFATLVQAGGVDADAVKAGVRRDGVLERPPSRASLPSVANDMGGLAAELSSKPSMFDPREIARIERYRHDEAIPKLFGGDPGTTQHALVRLNRLQGACRRIAARIAERVGPPIGQAHVERLWLTLLSRLPDAQESEWTSAWLARDPAGAELALADLSWALLNCQEFSNNH